MSSSDARQENRLLRDRETILMVRGLAVAGLVGVALVHIVQLPDTLRPTPAMGAMFAGLVAVSAAVSAALVHSDDWRTWYVAAAVGMAPVIGYIITRSVALPVDNEDVGNWSEPLGLAALFLESALVGLCAYRLLAFPRRVLAAR